MPKETITLQRRSKRAGTLRLVLVFVLLTAVNLYIFCFRRGTSLRALLHLRHDPQAALTVSATNLAPPPHVAPLGAPKVVVDETEESRVVEGQLGEGDTVERAWKRDGLPPRQIAELGSALGHLFDLRTVRAGHSYTLRFDGEEHLHSLDYRVSAVLGYHLERVGGAWKAAKVEKPLETRVVEVGGTIGSSLYDAVKRSGESTALVGWLVDMFAWDINFYVDSQAGDRFKLIIEKRYLAGKFYKYGHILAAEYKGRMGAVRAFWFQPRDGTAGGYYTEHGESVAKSLLKTPLKYVRISSAFDRHRFHPILHSERAHLGVDYAAPSGTPVWATASGRVQFVGPRGGAGNCVMIMHPGSMESIYMHLSRFARGLRVGQSVRQKQVIGYVGATGLATGPHLHFSLKVNDHFIDPLKVRAERETPVSARYRAEFVDAITPRLTALAAIDTAPKVAAAARGGVN